LLQDCFEQILRQAGWTKRNIAHAELTASLPEDVIEVAVKSGREGE
jgi:hypothetical protein